MTPKKVESYECPIQRVLCLIGGKWKPLVLWYLKDEKKRFGELRKLIPGCTQKILTQHLRDLEAAGLVNRKIYAEIPPRVEYSMSEWGETLKPVLEVICYWGEDYERWIGVRK